MVEWLKGHSCSFHQVLDGTIKSCGLDGLVVHLVKCWTEVSKVMGRMVL